MRIRAAGADACQRLPVLLRVFGMQGTLASKSRALLHILLIRLGGMPVDAKAAIELSLNSIRAGRDPARREAPGTKRESCWLLSRPPVAEKIPALDLPLPVSTWSSTFTAWYPRPGRRAKDVTTRLTQKSHLGRVGAGVPPVEGAGGGLTLLSSPS